jgi:FAD/FMN-containing dehydrogenase
MRYNNCMKQLFDTVEAYQAKRERVVEQMKARSSGQVMLKKNTSNLFRTREGTRQRLDVRELNRVIKVNPQTLVAEVEGMTTYETLVAATLQYGCLPTVVPELNTITIGGALAGAGIESSSFKYGLVHETILEVEVLLSDGSVVKASPTVRPDLFYGLPNTFGTLGYVLKLKVKLVKAAPYVRLRHIPFPKTDELFATVKQVAKTGKYDGEPVDFMDASVYGLGKQFLTLGNMVDNAPYTGDYTYMKMYYRSIQHKQEDFLTTKDYIWRWDPDWFWCSDRFGADKWPVRLIFGKWLLKSRSYWKIVGWDRKYRLAERWKRLTRDQTRRESVIQDVQVPIEKAAGFLDFLHDKIGILPIWICPTRSYDPTRHFSFMPLQGKELYVNFGFWDFVVTDKDPAKGYYNSLIERQLAKIGGSKGLYSESFYTEDEFWKIYDQPTYRQLKNKYDAQAKLKDLYEKIKAK